MIKTKRENVASISFSMFIIKCIFFIYLFSVNIYSYPVGNERHKVVSIIWFTKIIMAVQCDSNSYEDIYNYFGEMECNTWANGGQAECTQIFIYLQVITSYINDKIKFSCEQYMYQYCLLATFGLCVDGLYGGGMEWGIGGS